MKKVIGGLTILVIVGLVLAACSNPINFAGSRAAASGIVWNGASDRGAAVDIAAVQNDVRKNASGPKITSNAHSADFPGLYFIWDSKQADNGYLKVEASLFDVYSSFILTAKVSNTYWDFEIAVQPGQELTADDCYVFFIPKVPEAGKNINMVFVSEFKEIPQAELVAWLTLDPNENPVDIPNPDRGFYVVSGPTLNVGGGSVSMPGLTGTAASASVTSTIVYVEVNLRNFSSNAPASGRPRGPWTTGTYATSYGETQPITQAALDSVRGLMQQIRNANATAILKFHYDYGNTYIDSGAFDFVVHDCEPGAPQGRAFHEANYEAWTEWLPQQPGAPFTNAQLAQMWVDFRKEFRLTHPVMYTEPGATSDSCGIPGHEEKNWVEYHIWQFGEIYREFEDCIASAKAGMFGAWGEMHSTSYARTSEGYNWLLNAFLREVPESRKIQVHSGGVMAWHNEEYGTDYNWANMMPPPAQGTPASRFGMFNDSYSYGYSADEDAYNDNGSLSEGWQIIGSKTEDGIEGCKDFDRYKVLLWIRGQNAFYGGETVGGSSVYATFPNVPFEAAIARTTHLNRSTISSWGTFVYNEANVTRPFTTPHDGIAKQAIFDPVYDGMRGSEYFRDRMGYRLVLREANASEWVDQKGTLKFEGKIQNVGFSNVINRKNVAVILKAKDGSGTYSALTNLDARDWLTADIDMATYQVDSRATNTDAWRDLSFAVKLSAFGSVPAGEYDILLKIDDPKETTANLRCIRFANKGDVWDAALGANLIGSTTVL